MHHHISSTRLVSHCCVYVGGCMSYGASHRLHVACCTLHVACDGVGWDVSRYVRYLRRMLEDQLHIHIPPWVPKMLTLFASILIAGHWPVPPNIRPSSSAFSSILVSFGPKIFGVSLLFQSLQARLPCLPPPPLSASARKFDSGLFSGIGNVGGTVGLVRSSS